MKKRQQAFAHHGRKCKKCGSEKNIQVHHLHYRTVGMENPKRDLVPLCRKCHKKEHDLE